MTYNISMVENEITTESREWPSPYEQFASSYGSLMYYAGEGGELNQPLRPNLVGAARQRAVEVECYGLAIKLTPRRLYRILEYATERILTYTVESDDDYLNYRRSLQNLHKRYQEMVELFAKKRSKSQSGSAS